MSAPRILLVDDNEDALRYLESVFSVDGAQVTGVKDASQVISIVESANPPFDLVGVDIRMPGMKGPEIAKSLRSKGFKGTIVAFSAMATAEDRKSCEDAGIDSYFSKSVLSTKVVEALFASLKPQQ